MRVSQKSFLRTFADTKNRLKLKIICIGKNYQAAIPRASAKPEVPVIFLKPDSSVLTGGNPFFIPEFSGQITIEAELTVRISRLGKYIPEKFAYKYYDAFSVGVDFTAADLYSKLSAAGLPVEISKGFDGAAVIGQWINKNALPAADEGLKFSMERNGDHFHEGNSKDMIFGVDKIISYVSQFYTLKIGDVIFTGSPVPSDAVKAEDRFTGKLEGKEVFSLKIK